MKTRPAMVGSGFAARRAARYKQALGRPGLCAQDREGGEQGEGPDVLDQEIEESGTTCGTRAVVGDHQKVG